jgi:hypothetical protein
MTQRLKEQDTVPWTLSYVLGDGGIAPRILDFGTRWRWVVSVTPRQLYPRERAPGTHWIGGWVGPRAVLDAVVKRKIPSPRQESNSTAPIFQPVAQLAFSQKTSIWIFKAVKASMLHILQVHNLVYALNIFTLYAFSRNSAPWKEALTQTIER